ncbi:hypothetical protein ADL15_01900 [Actinoplanes awajinensis subsp. mycoplanecinus]|uniref:Uncharacterized protein n=1 Tax=Actinoplanes awajinensis subsp. mycoplanecinus TaxID=135947 RepID=A0A0X3VBG3_9ACTN|nr:hypothetical protein ADL15_01900 [Actinoplanes awajinensis subsp. mycoplanecinus]
MTPMGPAMGQMPPMTKPRRAHGVWAALVTVALAAAAGGAFAALEERPQGPSAPRSPAGYEIPRRVEPTEIPMPTARPRRFPAVPVVGSLPPSSRVAGLLTRL